MRSSTRKRVDIKPCPLGTLHLCCASSCLAASQVLSQGASQSFLRGRWDAWGQPHSHPSQKNINVWGIARKSLRAGSYPYMPCLVKGHSRDLPAFVHSLHFGAFLLSLTCGKDNERKVTDQPEHVAKVHYELKVARNLEAPRNWDWGPEFTRLPVCKTKWANKNNPSGFDIVEKSCANNLPWQKSSVDLTASWIDASATQQRRAHVAETCMLPTSSARDQPW